MTKKKKEYTNPTYPTGTLFSSGREYLHSTIFTKPAEKREQLKQKIVFLIDNERIEKRGGLMGKLGEFISPPQLQELADKIMKEIEKQE